MTITIDLDRHDPDFCADPTCPDPAHMPDRDTTWGEADDAAWLWDDGVQRRRSDR